MNIYSLYADVSETFDFPSTPTDPDISALVRYEWGDVIDTFSATLSGNTATISIPGDMIMAGGGYDIRWSVELDGTTRFFNSSFLVEQPYITEAAFMDIYEDMNTSEYGGDVFTQAESVARRIIDTFCGQNFQFIGNKILSKEGNNNNKLYLGKKLNHIYTTNIVFDDRTEDYSDLVEIDYASKYAIRCEKKFPSSAIVKVTGDWGWIDPPKNIREACAMLVLDILENTRREHHSYGILRMDQDTNRVWFDSSIFSESTGNLDVDVLLMDYVYWIPDWI